MKRFFYIALPLLLMGGLLAYGQMTGQSLSDLDLHSDWTSNLVYVPFAILAGFALFASFDEEAQHRRWHARRRERRARVLEFGVDGRVVVRKVQATRERIDGNPTLCLDVTVHVDGRPAQEVVAKYTIAFLVAPHILPGTEYRARMDPEDATNLLIDSWEPS